MGTTYVTGHVFGDRGVEGVRKALRDSGFGERRMIVQRQTHHPQPPLAVRRRAVPQPYATLWGAGGGALSLVSIGPIAHALLQEVQLGSWFENWVSASMGTATLQAMVVGAVLGAVLGFFTGYFEMRPVTAPDTDFVVGVHVPAASSETAEDALRRGGTRDVARHGD